MCLVTEHYALPPEGKRPLGRSSGRWENIKVDVKAIGCECMEWVCLKQVRDQYVPCGHGNKPRDYTKDWESLDQLFDCTFFREDYLPWN